MSEVSRFEVADRSPRQRRVRSLLGCLFLAYLLALAALPFVAPVALVAAGVPPAEAVRASVAAVAVGYLLGVATVLRW